MTFSFNSIKIVTQFNKLKAYKNLFINTIDLKLKE